MKRWLPSLTMMALIFIFSSMPSEDLPEFGLLDYLLKKSGHAFGYGLLALANLYGLGGRETRKAWLMTILYAILDEYHQSFVPGRHPSVIDVFVFDNLGAFLALSLFHAWKRWRGFPFYPVK